jgi:CDP-glucose 4,6-dehydratase
MYVEDGVMAYLTLAEALEGRRALSGRAFNFGHRDPITVLGLVEKILAVCRRDDLAPDVRDETEHEIFDQYLDPSRARAELGWEARFTHEAGLSRAVDWYREFLGRTAQR